MSLFQILLAQCLQNNGNLTNKYQGKDNYDCVDDAVTQFQTEKAFRLLPAALATTSFVVFVIKTHLWNAPFQPFSRTEMESGSIDTLP